MTEKELVKVLTEAHNYFTDNSIEEINLDSYPTLVSNIKRKVNIVSDNILEEWNKQKVNEMIH